MSERGYELARLMDEMEIEAGEVDSDMADGTETLGEETILAIQTWIEHKRAEPPAGRFDATYKVVTGLLAEVERQRLVITRYSEQRQALRDAIGGVLTETESLEHLQRVWDRTKVPPR